MGVPLPSGGLLGFGFRINGRYSVESKTYPVCSPPSANITEYPVGNLTYDVPEGVSVTPGDGQPMTGGEAYVAESGLDMQKHFAAQANVSGSYGGFSGQVEAMFGSDTENSQSSWLAIVEGRHVAFSITIDNPQPDASFLADRLVKAMLSHSLFDPKSPEDFFRVFRRFGTHVVVGVDVGAKILYAATIARSANSDKLSVGAKLSVEYKAVTHDQTTTEVETDWASLTSAWASSRRVSIAAIGGTSELLNGLDPSFGESCASAFTKWLGTVDERPGIVDLHLKSLSHMFESPVAEMIDEAITEYLKYGIYVEATISSTTYSGFVEVSGTVEHPKNPNTASGGIQLVIVDAQSGTTVYNKTVYGAGVNPTDAWTQLLGGVSALSSSEFYPVLTVFNWNSSSGYPPTEAASWLENCGASLAGWRSLQADAVQLTYTFIGKSGALPGQGLECIDWDRGDHKAFASSSAPLVPKDGGGFSIELGALQ